MQPHFQRASSLQGANMAAPFAGSPSKRRKMFEVDEGESDTSSLPRLDQIDASVNSPNLIRNLIAILAEPTRSHSQISKTKQVIMTLKLCDETKPMVDVKLFTFPEKTQWLPKPDLPEGTIIKLDGIKLDGKQPHIKIPKDGSASVMNPTGLYQEPERSRVRQLARWWASSGRISQLPFPPKTLAQFHSEIGGGGASFPPATCTPHSLVCRIESIDSDLKSQNHAELIVFDGTGEQVDLAAPDGLAPLRAVLSVWPEYKPQFTPDKVGQWILIAPVKRKDTNKFLALTLDSKLVSPMRLRWLPPGDPLIPTAQNPATAAGGAQTMIMQPHHSSTALAGSLKRTHPMPVQPAALEERRVISKVAQMYEQHQRVEIRDLPNATWAKYLEQAPPRRRDEMMVFKIVCKVTCVLPEDAADLCSLACGHCGRFYDHSLVSEALADPSETAQSCPNCGVTSPPEWRFKFTLMARSHNSDALINILVCNQEATLFLGNLAPTNLRNHPAALRVLKEYIAEMLADPAYLEVCVRAIKDPEASLLPELPRYRLIDTVLCPYRNLDTVLKGGSLLPQPKLYH